MTGSVHDAARANRHLSVGPSGSGKTQHLIDQLVQLRLDHRDAWDTTLVWVRTPAAAAVFRQRLEKAAAAHPDLSDGYRAFRITTAHDWAKRVLTEGRYDVPRRSVWPTWVEREAIRAACVEHADRWPEGGDKVSADVPAYHTAVLQWAGTLALNALDPATLPDGLDAPNAHRARHLAAVLRAVAQRKGDGNALGTHDLFPELLRAFQNMGRLDKWRAKVRTLVIDDAQDLPLGAAKLAAVWANDDNYLWVCADPDAATARFQGAIPRAALHVATKELGMHATRAPETPPASVVRAAAACIRQEPAPQPPDAEPRIVCVRVADDIEEAYELARRVRHAVYAARNDAEPLRYGHCAIVTQSQQPTGAYLADALAFYDVPFARRVGAPLANSPVVRYALEYVRALDAGADLPPPELLAHGFAGKALPVASVHLALGPARDVRVLRDVLNDPEAPLPDGLDRDAAQAWFQRWDALRAKWRERGELGPVLRHIAEEQLLPVLDERDWEREESAHAFQHLRQLLQLADTLDRAEATRALRLAALERTALEERAAEAWEEDDLGRDAVHILTPYAARDFRFRWMALAGFTSGRWPPPHRAHLLRLDHATAAWLGEEPLTLWTPDADTHDAEWRNLAATAIDRCDGTLLITVPAEDSDGAPLDASAWLEELGDLVREEPPLADPARGLTLDAALTATEAQAALRALKLPDEVRRDAYTAFPVDEHIRDFRERDTPIHFDELRISASLLNSYLTCPRQCYYVRLLKAEDRDPEADAPAQFGTMLHAVLQALHGEDHWRRWSADDTDRMLADALELLEAHWHTRDMAAVYSNLAQARAMYARAEKSVEQYVRWCTAEQAGVEVLDTEVGLTVPLERGTLTATIDRVDRLQDGRVRIIDYKSGTVHAGGKTVAGHFVNVTGKSDWRPVDVQLLTYWLIAEQAGARFGAVAETSLCGLKPDGDKPPRFPTIVWDDTPVPPKDKTRFALTAQDRNTAQAVFTDTIDAVFSGHFPATPRTPGECRKCAARAVCTRTALVDESDSDAEDAWD